ncbi:hypothetical protein SISNIDRAFT_474240 [Sistotremastrum niveocremeum HHB9708]|uniref:DUF6570 domain-containing protein n=1 Tax=Sistotremastrum niveocremeum HHB9708 TaxID=1314777 RepID=A0A164V006_9AGAM|nr:hypothetical protein SISNIDRAFT_474240 [Sistotremastrum niveocremeum HHB9708]
MLDQRGIHQQDGNSVLTICGDCDDSLHKKQVPKFSLRNNLYRGTLPVDLQDLTWIEEKVCAIYRTTAVVTKLHYVDSPENPYVLRGNTCAFDTNFVSTATVLPRTPADVLGTLSVVFVGPHEIKLTKLGTIFRVRKAKICRFLNWLRANNPLYKDIPIDEATLALFPDDGVLPDLESPTQQLKQPKPTIVPTVPISS